MFGNFDYDRLFYYWKTATAFGVAAALAVALLVLRNIYINFGGLGRPAVVAISLVGAAVAAGAFSLLGGMLCFWVKCDPFSKRLRSIWLFILLAVFFYGVVLIYGAILYYLAVYLPRVNRWLRAAGEETD